MASKKPAPKPTDQAPEIKQLIEEPAVEIIEPKTVELVPFQVEEIPHLVFTDKAGGLYYLDPGMTRGAYILRSIPRG